MLWISNDQVEKGDPSVAMGIYAEVLHALNNLHKDLLLLAKDDTLDRQIQDLNLITRKRVSRRKNSGVPPKQDLV